MNSYPIQTGKLASGFLKFISSDGFDKLPPDLEMKTAPKRPKQLLQELNCTRNFTRDKTIFMKYYESEINISLNDSDSFQMEENETNKSVRQVAVQMPSFRQFVHYTLEQVLGCEGLVDCLIFVEPHITPASVRCPPCLVQNDFIFKVRNKILINYT